MLAACLLYGMPCLAAPVEISVTSQKGIPISDCLVIVQDLQHQEKQLFRALTDARGKVPPHDLSPGLYRAIGTYPYGQWQNDVREFLVSGSPVQVQLKLSPVESLDLFPIAIGRLTLHVLNADGKPVHDARVLVRDADATPSSEHWGTTDAQGVTTLELTLNPAALVVVYRDRLYTFPANGLDTERTVRLR